MVSGKDVVEEGYPREVILQQTLEEHACQGDEPGKSFREGDDGVEMGSRCPVAEAAAQRSLQKEWQPEDPWRDSDARFPHSTSLLWLGSGRFL